MIPLEIINKIFLYIESPTNQIMKYAIEYYNWHRYVGSFRRFYFINVMYHRKKYYYISDDDTDY
jgi:hypothetical protein